LTRWSYSQHSQICPCKSPLPTLSPHQVIGREAKKKRWIWGSGRELWNPKQTHP